MGFGLGLYTANLWTTIFEVVDPAARSGCIDLINVFAGVVGFTNSVVGWPRGKGVKGIFETVFAWLSVPAGDDCRPVHFARQENTAAGIPGD